METIFLESKNRTLVSTLHHPQNINYKTPIVIVHGYLATNRIGYYRLYYDIAKKLENLGYIVLRFDLSGFGESDTPIEEVILEDHVDDISTAANFLMDRFNVSQVNVIAHCIGCTSASVFLKQNINLVEQLVLINPFYLKSDYIYKLLSELQVNELKEIGYTYRKGFFIHSSFFNNKYTLSNVMNTIENQTNLLISEEDIYIDNEDLDIISKKYKVIYKANHDFIQQSTRKELINELNEILGNSNKPLN